MRWNSRTAVALGLMALTVQGALATATTAPREQHSDRGTDVAVQPQADSGSRDRIVEAIGRKYNASVVRVAELVVDGRRVYELRLLSNERVWTVRVDAETGRELPSN
jgi:uncharacterized membrane protein YkoI